LRNIGSHVPCSSFYCLMPEPDDIMSSLLLSSARGHQHLLPLKHIQLSTCYARVSHRWLCDAVFLSNAYPEKCKEPSRNDRRILGPIGCKRSPWCGTHNHVALLIRGIKLRFVALDRRPRQEKTSPVTCYLSWSVWRVQDCTAERLTAAGVRYRRANVS
jgi:hypothetical protein